MKIAFYKGKGTLVDRMIRWWQRGLYSHVEAVLAETGDGTFECASSVRGAGVRIAAVALAANEWDVLDMPADVDAVRAWFTKHAGLRYDYLGILGFVVRPVGGEPRHYFCSEAIATALGLAEPFRLDPNALADLVRDIARVERTTTA